MNATHTESLGIPMSEWTTPFDFFLGAHVPALDGVLSRSDQSIFLELLFWMTAYLIYGAVVSEWLRTAWSRTAAWKSGVDQKIGVFCGNAQDDIILMNMLSVHHCCAGGMSLLGHVLGDINLFRHGLMLELGFEIADVLSMNPLFPMFPYRHDNMKLDAYVALLFHHVPTITMGVLGFQVENGMANPHIHQIVIWFLMGAAFSCLGAIFVETRNVDTRAGLLQATASLIANCGFWYYCRFHVWQREGYALWADVTSDPLLKDTPAVQFMMKFFILLSVFNGIVLIDILLRIVRYIMRSFNGTTVLEWGTVPPSREERFKKLAAAAKQDKKVQ